MQGPDAAPLIRDLAECRSQERHVETVVIERQLLVGIAGVEADVVALGTIECAARFVQHLQLNVEQVQSPPVQVAGDRDAEVSGARPDFEYPLEAGQVQPLDGTLVVSAESAQRIVEEIRGLMGIGITTRPAGLPGEGIQPSRGHVHLPAIKQGKASLIYHQRGGPLPLTCRHAAPDHVQR